MYNDIIIFSNSLDYWNEVFYEIAESSVLKDTIENEFDPNEPYEIRVDKAHDMLDQGMLEYDIREQIDQMGIEEQEMGICALEEWFKRLNENGSKLLCKYRRSSFDPDIYCWIDLTNFRQFKEEYIENQEGVTVELKGNAIYITGEDGSDTRIYPLRIEQDEEDRFYNQMNEYLEHEGEYEWWSKDMIYDTLIENSLDRGTPLELYYQNFWFM